MAVTTLQRWHLTSAYASSHMLLLLGGGEEWTDATLQRWHLTSAYIAAICSSC